MSKLLRDALASLCRQMDVDSPIAFRRVLRQTGALVFGPAALYFIHPDVLICEQLEITVLDNKSGTLITKFKSWGFIESSPITSASGLATVVLTKPSVRKRIHVVLFPSGTSAIKWIATTQGCTLFKCYMAHYGLVSLYRDWTEAKAGLIADDSNDPIYDYYRAAGFNLFDRPSTYLGFKPRHICEIDSCCVRTTRFLWDSDVQLTPFASECPPLATLEPDNISWALPLPCPGYPPSNLHLYVGRSLKDTPGYHVEYIVKARYVAVNRRDEKIIRYKIKWAGYSSSENSWEPSRNLVDCERLKDSFWHHIGYDAVQTPVGEDITPSSLWVAIERGYFWGIHLRTLPWEEQYDLLQRTTAIGLKPAQVDG